MSRWIRARAIALAAVTACAAVATLTGPAHVAEADGGLVEQAEWRPFPKDTSGHGYIAVDSAARVGYAFSGTAGDGLTWNRVQALDLATGKPISPLITVPDVGQTAPLYVDTKRHMVVWTDWYPASGTALPSVQRLHGVGYRNGQVKQLFTLPAPTGQLRIAGMTPDERNADLVIVATADGVSQRLVSGASLIDIHRLSLDDLAAGKATTRWANAARVPAGACNSLIQNVLPAAVLVVADRTYLACRGAGMAFTGGVSQLALGGTSGIVEVTGTGTKAGTITARAYRTAGNFALAGAESVADPGTRRMMMVEAGGNNGFRVFDTDHKRYVGRINGGALQFYGYVPDSGSGRLYFISGDPQVGLGYGDNKAIVPTQGERLRVPYAALFSKGTTRRLSFDPVTRRLFVPLRRTSETDGKLLESVLVMKDVAEPYVAPPGIDHATGTVDTVDRAGVTESEQAATARAYGADYQVIGGTANLIQNITSVDTRGAARPGTRFLRQAYVKSANLTGDGAIASATVAEQDPTTDLDRHEHDLGDEFAPVAECADFGAGAVTATKHTATVVCDLAKETVTAKATYDAASGVLVTGNGTAAPVAAPVQMGDALVEVSEKRAANRGALVTTMRAVADNVTIGGVVKFGRVEQVVTITAHGRSGTAKVDRVVKISEVSANGAPLCGATCSIASVQKQINTLADGRFWVDFPAAQSTVDKRGTYAELVQDPYVHAERSFDYDKPTDDYVIPALSVVTLMDGVSKTRLVTDFAGVAGTASYRTFPMSDDDFDGGDDDGGGGDDTGVGNGNGNAPAPVATAGPAAPQPKKDQTVPPVVAGGQDAQQYDGVFGGVLERVRLSLRSLGDALPLLLIWALLGVPAYLSARRRLLLELPMLTRDEDLS